MIVEYFIIFDRPGSSRDPWVRIRSQFVWYYFHLNCWRWSGKTLSTTSNMYIKWQVSSIWSTLLFKSTAQNLQLRKKLNVNVKSQSKCIKIVLEKISIKLFMIKLLSRLNVMYTKVVTLNEHYLFIKNYCQIY